MLDLPLAGLGVLFPRVEVQARTGVEIVAEENLLAGFVFDGDLLWGGCVDAEFSPPGEGAEEAGGGFGGRPFRGAEVPEEAFAREPHAFGVGDGGGGAVTGGGVGDVGP